MLDHIKIKLSKLCKQFWKEKVDIKLVFSSAKIKNHFSYKEVLHINWEKPNLLN